MLVSVNSIIGTRITSLKEGKPLDTVKDVIYEPSENKIAAFIVREKKLFSDTYLLPFSSVENIGHDLIMINSAYDIRKVSDVPESISYIARHNFYLTDSKIITQNGRTLGVITDMFFDSGTGEVKELEITERTKLLNRTISKKIIKIADIITVGRQATIIKDLSNTEPTQPAQPDYETTSTPHTELESSAEDDNKKQDWSTISFTDDYIAFIESKLKNEEKLTKDDLEVYKSHTEHNKKGNVVGMYLTKNILLENDNFFAQAGELITHKMLDEAEEQNILDQVLNNATPLPPTLNAQIKSSSNRLVQ